jgi:hypothetical protein
LKRTEKGKIPMTEILLTSLVSALPQIAIAIVGLILVHTRLREFHQRAYLYGTTGLALMLLNGLWGALARTYALTNAAQSLHPVELANKLSMVGLISYVLLSASLVLLLAALLADRDSIKGPGDSA